MIKKGKEILKTDILSKKLKVIFLIFIFLSIFDLLLEIVLLSTGVISPSSWYVYVSIFVSLVLFSFSTFKLFVIFRLKEDIKKNKV